MKGTVVRLAGIAAVVLGTVLPGVAWAAEEAPSRFRALGEITAVHLEASTFDLHTRAGEDLVITVKDETRFISREGEIAGLADVEAGMTALVRGEVTPDGEHIAHRVSIGKPGDRPDRPDHNRFLGSVASIGDASFTIHARAGGQVTFLVNEETRFHSRDGSVQGLGDLKAGMHVAVGAVKQDDGSLLAVNVFAGEEDRPDRPHADVRAAGRIVELGNREFTIESHDGRRMTFSVTENTAFKSRNGQVNGFGDLEVGMGVAVAAKKSADGSLTAILVFAGPDRPDRDGRPDRSAPEPRTTPEPAPTATPSGDRGD